MLAYIGKIVLDGAFIDVLRLLMFGIWVREVFAKLILFRFDSDQLGLFDKDFLVIGWGYLCLTVFRVRPDRRWI